jgi:hypothetical protein
MAETGAALTPRSLLTCINSHTSQIPDQFPFGHATMHPETNIESPMRSDLNDFITKYLSLVGASLMLFGFIAFALTVYDPERATGVSNTPQLTQPVVTTQPKI